MTDWWRRFLLPAAFGSLAALVTLVAIVLLPASVRESMREHAIDDILVLAAATREQPAPASPIAIIDIDSASLEALGPWPWSRDVMATLVNAAASAGAAAVAIDVLFEGADSRSLATLARRLGRDIDRADLVELAEALPDGDRQLVAAFDRVPVALGFALDPDHAGEVPGVPVLVQGELALADIWRGVGAAGPYEPLARAAAGMGVLALPGDADGLVRRVPLFVGVRSRLHPGLALEAVRLAQGASAYRLAVQPQAVAAGDIRVALPTDGFLRLVPGTLAARPPVRLSAADVVRGLVPAERMHGAIVFIGGSAPELGGLRPAPGDPLTPSVAIQAAAASQVLRGIVPVPIAQAGLVAVVLPLVTVLAGILAAALLRPVPGFLVVTAVVCTPWIAAGMAARSDRLLDPTLASILAGVAYFATAIAVFAEAHQREARIRQRFEQHLAPQVVALIAADPSLLKLRGQRREITALFTDIEAFTAMTRRADPEQLVSVLDEYFEGVAKIVIAHGGMIDKLVGDAVHAFFNSPVDLADHPLQAVRCAIAIRSWTESYRRTALPASLALGRTRIGIETGDAIVGDIGIRAKLDYTAHGDAVNAAARFEAANKELGSAICVGPQAAARCDPGLLRPTGWITPRGFASAVATFEPWPDDANASWRMRYLAAVGLAANDSAAAIDHLAALAAERPHDLVPAKLAEQLKSGDHLPAAAGA